MVYEMDKENRSAVYKSGGEEWGSGSAQYIDFIVTEDCNLRCKYCYICHKQSGKAMPIETAKKFIDYLFSGKVTHMPAVVISFIGGEPFIETDLMDKITDYFKMKAYEAGSDWAWNYRISATTNGVNYSSPSVQRYIKKNNGKISVSITLDGTREKHDLQRVFPDNSGSYDIIEKNIPLYLSQFAPTTKVTFAHDDLEYLKDSILHLWRLGINDVSANVVYEDVWEKGDDEIFERQLLSLADHIIENELYTENYVSLFDPNIGYPFTEENLKRTVCGAGAMLALGPNGKIYPCLRYKDYSIESGKDEISIGNVDDGIDFDMVRRFRISSCDLQCDHECISCDVAVGCSFCQGQSYDAADTSTNFQRSKYICKMHKARVRANRYYFNRLYNDKNIEPKGLNSTDKKIYIPMDSDFVSYCDMKNKRDISDNPISREVFEKGLKYCENNFASPVLVHSMSKPNLEIGKEYREHRIQHILSAKYHREAEQLRDYILVFDKATIDIKPAYQKYVILNIDWPDISSLSSYSMQLYKTTSRINLNIHGEPAAADIALYKSELEVIATKLKADWQQRYIMEFNRLTDIFFTKQQGSCTAGQKTLTLMPTGEVVTCAFDYMEMQRSIGSIEDDSFHIPNQRLYTYEKSPLCRDCSASHCNRCHVQNLLGTGEVNIPKANKCSVSMAEYQVSQTIQEDVSKLVDYTPKVLKDLVYEDPFTAFIEKTDNSFGYQIKA